MWHTTGMSTLLPLRAPPRGRSLLALALCGIFALSACATTSGAHATATPGAPQPTKIAARAGDTSLCNVVSSAEFARVTGEAATQVMPGTTTDSLTGLREVYCIYSDTSDPQQVIGRGTINFEVAADAQTATRTFQLVKQSFTGVADVPGVGDAAFAGTPGGAGAGTGLVVVRGTLLLYLSVGGDPQSVVRVTSQLAALALSRVT
jgi:hypothetical protein